MAGEPADIKCVAVGDATDNPTIGRIEKTLLLNRYTDAEWTPDKYCPSVFENTVVKIETESKNINLLLIDTAGQEDFDSLRVLSYPDTNVFLLVFGIQDRTSFTNAKDLWAPETRHHQPEARIVLVGANSSLRTSNPDDLSLVSVEEAHKAATDMGADAYMEVDAVTNEHVDELFDLLALVGLRSIKPRQTFLEKITTRVQNFFTSRFPNLVRLLTFIDGRLKPVYELFLELSDIVTDFLVFLTFAKGCKDDVPSSCWFMIGTGLSFFLPGLAALLTTRQRSWHTVFLFFPGVNLLAAHLYDRAKLKERATSKRITPTLTTTNENELKPIQNRNDGGRDGGDGGGSPENEPAKEDGEAKLEGGQANLFSTMVILKQEQGADGLSLEESEERRLFLYVGIFEDLPEALVQLYSVLVSTHGLENSFLFAFSICLSFLQSGYQLSQLETNPLSPQGRLLLSIWRSCEVAVIVMLMALFARSFDIWALFVFGVGCYLFNVGLALKFPGPGCSKTVKEKIVDAFVNLVALRGCLTTGTTITFSSYLAYKIIAVAVLAGLCASEVLAWTSTNGVGEGLLISVAIAFAVYLVGILQANSYAKSYYSNALIGKIPSRPEVKAAKAAKQAGNTIVKKSAVDQLERMLRR